MICFKMLSKITFLSLCLFVTAKNSQDKCPEGIQLKPEFDADQVTYQSIHYFKMTQTFSQSVPRVSNRLSNRRLINKIAILNFDIFFATLIIIHDRFEKSIINRSTLVNKIMTGKKL